MRATPVDRPIGNPATILQQCPDGWAVLVNLDTAGAVALNPTGLLVWRLVDGRRTVAGIAAAVAARFRNTPPTLTDEVAALLAILTEEGLVGYTWTGDADD